MTQQHHAPQAHYKRKQFWIDAPLQLQMLGYVLALITSSLLIVAFSILWGLSQRSAESKQIFHSLEWVRDTITQPLMISSVLSILAAGLLTLIWSHRFAGPLRVISAGIARLRQGNLTVPVRIRATDTHQELAKEFAQMQDQLRQMLTKDRARAERLSERLRAAAKNVEGHKAHAELEAVARELSALGSEFQL